MNRTEKEKMLAGELYRSDDPELIRERIKARKLTEDFNRSRAHEELKRVKLLKRLFGKVSGWIWVEPPFYCDYGFNIELEGMFFANFNCVILDVAKVTIGDGVLLGPGVQIYTATHPLEASIRKTGMEFAKPITIGRDAWIGGGAIICPGVTIGEGAVIGAGSVVTKDIPPFVMAAGNPCRVIKSVKNP